MSDTEIQQSISTKVSVEVSVDHFVMKRVRASQSIERNEMGTRRELDKGKLTSTRYLS